MKKALPVTAVLLIAAGLAAGGWWGVRHSPEAQDWLRARLSRAEQIVGVEDRAGESGVMASGYIEAETVEVRTERGGRVLCISVEEGDLVTQDQVVAQLDDSLAKQQIVVARADETLAQAVLEQVRAGVRPETLRRAETEVAQAKAAQAAALTAWQDAQARLDSPQELDLALTTTRGRLEVLRYLEDQARALANARQTARDLADESLRLLEDLPPYVKVPASALRKARESQAAATNGSWAAWTWLDQAMAARQGAESLLAELTRQREDPLVLRAQVDAAESQYHIATAALELAESQVQGLGLGATPEQIQVAQAQVEVAEAARLALEVQLDRYVLRAPIAGLVLNRAAGAGEVVAEGVAVLSLADLRRLTVTAYIPESQLGQIGVGRPVSVTVDAFPGRRFPGVVQGIGSEAEYTPRNVQAHEERANIVFAVEVAMDNLDGALKPGMPADVWFSEGAAPTGAGLLDTPGGSQSQASLSATGSIECEVRSIVSEVGGKATSVLVAEGEAVAADQAVIRLDTRDLSAQLAKASAVEATSVAGLRQVRAGASPSEILAAQASLKKAAAERNAAESALRDAEAMLEKSQDLVTQIAQAEADIDFATAQIGQAESEVAAAEAERDRYIAQGSLEEKEMYASFDYQVQAAAAGLEAARANVQALKDRLAALEVMRHYPLALASKVHEAAGRRDVAEAGVAVAQAELEELMAGPSAEEVRVAEAQVAKAEAAVELVQIQLERLTLRAPVAGVVTSLLIHPGESATAGAVLATISDFDDASLALYVVAEELGRVRVGQVVEVRVDSFPAKAFSGHVSRIAQQAEFAPSDVQTAQDRASMVFAVTVRLPNPWHELRPGMTADGTFLGP